MLSLLVLRVSCRFRIIFYWQQPKGRGKKDYQWMNDSGYVKRTKNKRDRSALIFSSLSLSLPSFVVVRVRKSNVKETRWWYTIRNIFNRDGRQIERIEEKSMYDEQVLFLFFCLFVSRRSLIVSTINKLQFIIQINIRCSVLRQQS
jgi:hypothetical protein